MIGLEYKKDAKVAITEKERLRNASTFLTSNLFLLEPEEVDGTAGESTSIPSGSAILLGFDLRKLSYFVSSPLYYAARPSQSKMSALE